MSEELEQQTPEQVQVEKDARAMGWVPQSEYKDGDHFVDAETFVKRGREINPILRKNNETLLKKLEEAQKEVAEVKKVAKEFEAFQKEATERKLSDMEKQLKELKEQKKAAVSASDGDSVVAIDEAIDVVKEEQAAIKAKEKEAKTKPEESKTVTYDPIINEWLDDNQWFTTDLKMQRVADAVGVSINQQYPNLVGKKFFEKLDEELAEVLPEKYKKKTRTSPVEGSSQGTSRPTKTGKNSYENLPSDAKAACDRFVKQGLMTKEQYVAEFDFS